MREEISRRRFIKTAGVVAGALGYAGFARSDQTKQRYRIGVCDWMILKRQKLGAFQLTKEIGADGVEVDMGSLGVKGDLVKRPELRPAIVERLKAIAPKAEATRVTIGIKTSLDASAEVQLLKEIGSPAIRIYFNFANALQAGRDLYAELRTLGKERICQIHCTDEDGDLLETNKRLDMSKAKRTLDEMGWSGWLVIERSRDRNDPRNVKRNFGENTKYLRTIFQQ